MQNVIEGFKIRKDSNTKQKNGVKLGIISLNTKMNNSQQQRDNLLEKILRNKQHSGLVIDIPLNNTPIEGVDGLDGLDELDENIQYEPIAPVKKPIPEKEPVPPPPPNEEEEKQEDLQTAIAPSSIPSSTIAPTPPVKIPSSTKSKKKIKIIDKTPMETIPENNEISLPVVVPPAVPAPKTPLETIPENNELSVPAVVPPAVPTPKPATKKKLLVVNPSSRPIVNLQNEMVERLPPTKNQKTVILKTSRFYLNNRKLFLKNFDDIFKKYKKEIEEADKKDVSCDSKNETRDLFVHQKIVKDYLNLHTPYRGLLLYHGLGSGKTCTSIAIAEGMKIPEKRIFVLTPASLKMNYFSELKKCGDELYKKKQYWEFVSVEGQPEYLAILSTALSLSPEYITQNRGAWLVNVKKKSNFETLTTDQQKQIDAQINKMIRAKYVDLNYNGLNYDKLQALTESYTINPFDNSVVIVDEAHNFVSRIVNSLKKKGKKQDIPAPNNKPASISVALYQYLMSAINVRIVLLSGTPIINYPNEIAVLYNILRGYIKTWTFQITVGEGFKDRVNKETITNFFDKGGLKTFDYVEYSGNKLTVTRNPFGFINSKKTTDTTSKKATDTTSKKTSVAKTKKVTDTRPVAAPAEPTAPAAPTAEPTKKDKPNTTRKIKKVSFQPAEPTNLVVGGGVEDEYNGVYYDDPVETTYDGQGNITDDSFQTTITSILSKNGLYVPANGITIAYNKCLPDNEDDFFTTFVDMENTKMNNEDVFKRRILGLTSYFRSSQERLLPRFIPSLRNVERDGKQTTEPSVFHMIYCTMSNYQFKKYITIRENEIKQEKDANKQKALNLAKGVFIENSTYRIYSRAVCNFAFPDPPGRPFPNKKEEVETKAGEEETKAGEEEKDNIEQEQEQEEEEEDLNGMDLQSKNNYLMRIKEAMKAVNTPEYLSEANLAQYSPKFAEFLHIFGAGINTEDPENNPVDTKGCHLLYSNFRTIEGIGILRLALIQNGYEEFKIRKASNGIWEIVSDSIIGGSFSNTSTFKRFVLYTGTETAEEKEIIRNIYNGDWELVPSSIATVLKGVGYSDNMFGEVIRLFMITASGSEGINLKNTRFVHIIEPYWNLTRVEQIIGRASRICSHASLLEEFRTVKVYMYVSVFNSENTMENEMEPSGVKRSQIDIVNENVVLSQKESSRLNESVKLTTDESLLEISTIKNRINSQILKAVKETAIDCKLYDKSHSSQGLTCYNGYGIVKTNNFGSLPSIQQDIGERMEQNVERVQTRLVKVTIKGEAYKMNVETNELFKEVGEGKNKELEPVGRLKTTVNGQGKKEYIIVG